MKKNHLILFICLAMSLGFKSQTTTIVPQVINAAGGHRELGNTGIWITDNVGEPFTESVGYNVAQYMITQGFIQPETVTQAGFTLNAIQQSLQCLDKEDDAFIALTLTSTIANYDAQYFWEPVGTCPNNDCATVDTLKAGVYTVTVAIQYTTNIGAVRYDTITRNFVIDNATAPCKIKPFTGVSSNNDNVNDFFTIENIKEFPNNRVTIYNRWGGLLFDVQGYDQEIDGKRWPSDQDLQKLVSSTYFYIIELGDGGKPIKGWLELIKN